MLKTRQLCCRQEYVNVTQSKPPAPRSESRHFSEVLGQTSKITHRARFNSCACAGASASTSTSTSPVSTSLHRLSLHLNVDALFSKASFGSQLSALGLRLAPCVLQRATLAMLLIQAVEFESTLIVDATQSA